MNQIPNILSIFRIILAPIFFVFIISDTKELVIISFFLYLLAAFSDYLDGFLARKLNAISSFGNFFDPLADKILTSFAFIAFVIKDITPLWMVIIVILRDLITTLLRIYNLDNTKGLITSKLAKWKTFLQMLFIFFIITWITTHYLFPDFINFSLYIKVLKNEFLDYLMLILTLLSVYSLLDYVINIIKRSKYSANN